MLPEICFIVDGMFLLMLICLQLLVVKQNVTLFRLVRRANHVDNACDSFKNSSINDITRDHGLV